MLLAVAPSGAATLDASGSGGVPAEGEGGGIVAPGDGGTGLVPDGGGAPEAEAAQEPTPTTPGGEEQPPDEEPPVDEEPPGEEGGPVNPPEGDAGAGGFLPSTGLAVAALAAIGLGLLMAGVALRPTSTWPAPRDPLSRSNPRR